MTATAADELIPQSRCQPATDDSYPTDREMVWIPVAALTDAYGADLGTAEIIEPAPVTQPTNPNSQRQQAEQKARERWRSLATQSAQGVEYLRSRGIYTVDGSVRFGQRKVKEMSKPDLTCPDGALKVNFFQLLSPGPEIISG